MYDVDGSRAERPIAALAGTMIGPSRSTPVAVSGALITDLNSPKGVDVAADGAVIVAQGAFGNPDPVPGPVLRYDRVGSAP